jgi:hypothetical protein
MAKTAKGRHRQRDEEIDVRVFQDISIRFPGDVYILAVWTAMSDLSKTTPTCQPRTTVHGLARNFAMLYGPDYSKPLNSEDVEAVFRRHGISGNPTLRLEGAEELLTRLPISEPMGLSRVTRLPTPPRIAE